MTEKRPTKIHKLLDVDVDERFIVKGSGITMLVDESGVLREEWKPDLFLAPSPQKVLGQLIQDPSVIVKQKTMSESDENLLVRLWDMGARWVGRLRMSIVAFDLPPVYETCSGITVGLFPHSESSVFCQLRITGKEGYLLSVIPIGDVLKIEEIAAEYNIKLPGSLHRYKTPE